MFDVGYGAAFLAGLLSFASPCIVPIVPLYLAYLAGLSMEELRDPSRDGGRTRQIVTATVAFVLGFATVFVALGATASALGRALAAYFDVLSVVAGLVIILMGFHFLGLLRIGLLFREARFNLSLKPSNPLIAFVLGLAFAFGWTPCVGPILAGILFVAGAEATIGRGAMLLGAYALGMGLPFIAAAVFSTAFLGWAQRMRRHMRKIEIAVGSLMVVMGALFVSGQVSAISYWLIETFPAFSQIG